MKIKRFEDIIAWQRSQDLAIEVYKNFQDSKDLAFKNQISRAVISISNNIAEGFDRSSNAEFKRFLFIALGSCSEVKSMVYLALRLEYLTIEQFNELQQQAQEVSRIIYGLIKSL